MGVDTVLAIHAGTPLPSEAVNSQSAHHISIRRLGNIPGAQHLTVVSSPHSHGQPLRTPSPHLVSWERRLAHGRVRARAVKLFPRAASTPRKPQGHLCFAFTPCTTAFPQAPSAPQGAPKGRTPTRGDRQPWEEHRREVTPCDTCVPEAQERRGFGKAGRAPRRPSCTTTRTSPTMGDGLQNDRLEPSGSGRGELISYQSIWTGYRHQSGSFKPGPRTSRSVATFRDCAAL